MRLFSDKKPSSKQEIAQELRQDSRKSNEEKISRNDRIEQLKQREYEKRLREQQEKSALVAKKAATLESNNLLAAKADKPTPTPQTNTYRPPVPTVQTLDEEQAGEAQEFTNPTKPTSTEGTDHMSSLKNETSETGRSLTEPSTSKAGVSVADENNPRAVVGSKICFKGDLSGEEDLLVQGKIEGTIDLKGHHLTIGKLGNVKADLFAKTITIDGQVEGDMTAEERISINQSSKVHGNLIADRVTLEDGAKFKGSIDMDISTPDKASSSTASTNTSNTGGNPNSKP